MVMCAGALHKKSVAGSMESTIKDSVAAKLMWRFVPGTNGVQGIADVLTFPPTASVDGNTLIVTGVKYAWSAARRPERRCRVAKTAA